MRANWSLAIGLALIAAACTLGSIHRHREEAQRGPRSALAAARADIDAVLAEIGGGVWIAEVRLVPLVGLDGTYSDRVITLSRRLAGDPERRLEVAAHECVHAMFDQGWLRAGYRPLAVARAEEVAAEVLGARLAASVLSTRGRDGAALRARMLGRVRSACARYGGADQEAVARTLERERGSAAGGFEVEMALVHSAPVEVLQGIEAICAEEGDAWDAARAIAGRFMRPPSSGLM